MLLPLKLLLLRVSAQLVEPCNSGREGWSHLGPGCQGHHLLACVGCQAPGTYLGTFLALARLALVLTQVALALALTLTLALALALVLAPALALALALVSAACSSFEATVPAIYIVSTHNGSYTVIYCLVL